MPVRLRWFALREVKICECRTPLLRSNTPAYALKSRQCPPATKSPCAATVVPRPTGAEPVEKIRARFARWSREFADACHCPASPRRFRYEARAVTARVLRHAATARRQSAMSHMPPKYAHRNR